MNGGNDMMYTIERFQVQCMVNYKWVTMYEANKDYIRQVFEKKRYYQQRGKIVRLERTVEIVRLPA